MKRLGMLFVLTLSSLAVPTLAHACWKIVSVVTFCDDCGELEGTVTCQAGYSTGFQNCTSLCIAIPCGEGDCRSLFFAACGNTNCSNGSVEAADTRTAPTVAALFPNSDGGYSEATALSSSCGASQGAKP